MPPPPDRISFVNKYVLLMFSLAFIIEKKDISLFYQHIHTDSQLYLGNFHCFYGLLCVIVYGHPLHLHKKETFKKMCSVYCSIIISNPVMILLPPKWQQFPLLISRKSHHLLPCTKMSNEISKPILKPLNM